MIPEYIWILNITLFPTESLSVVLNNGNGLLSAVFQKYKVFSLKQLFIKLHLINIH